MITKRLARLLMTAVMASLPACSGEILTVPMTGHSGQLTFRGGVHVAESFPVQLGSTLEIRNTAESPTGADAFLLTDRSDSDQKASRQAGGPASRLPKGEL